MKWLTHIPGMKWLIRNLYMWSGNVAPYQYSRPNSDALREAQKQNARAIYRAGYDLTPEQKALLPELRDQQEDKS